MSLHIVRHIFFVAGSVSSAEHGAENPDEMVTLDGRSRNCRRRKKFSSVFFTEIPHLSFSQVLGSEIDAFKKSLRILDIKAI